MEENSILSDPSFKIERELGEGGGGKVYKAWHTRLEKYVVIKELKDPEGADTGTRRNEAEALKNVKSPYLPQVLDFIQQDGRVFTVMEFVEGESMDKLLDRGEKFTQQQVVKWFGQLASALSVIHKQNICHRDIKPANIMLGPSGDVCLIDFNAALVSGNDVRLISRSLGYASPEQYEIYESFKKRMSAPEVPDDGSDEELTEILDKTKKPEVKPKNVSLGIDWKLSDIYSLGATMYHLLSGVRPPENAEKTASLKKSGKYGMAVVSIIEKCMSLEPKERFPSAAQLYDAINSIYKLDSRWRASKRRSAIAGAVLALAFAGFAGMTVFGSKTMAQEKEERYFNDVYGIINGSEPESSYDDALSLFWDRIDPYRAMAERLWNDGDAAACREYIESNLGNIAEFRDVPEARADYGGIYYILGNTYYQAAEPDYAAARDCFKTATENAPNEPAYFRDYAISLARTGDSDGARKIISRADELGISDDSLSLLNGEAAFSDGDFEAAAEILYGLSGTSGDEYIRYRAVKTADEAYRRLGMTEKSAELLESCFDKIPVGREFEMKERLADAYIALGDTEKAIGVFEELIGEGSPDFRIMQDLAILYHNAGKFELADDILKKMSEDFPDNYRVPMRQAFLEADRQSMAPTDERDYSAAEKYFESAQEMYKNSVKPGESDPEMQRLEGLISELRDNGWL